LKSFLIIVIKDLLFSMTSADLLPAFMVVGKGVDPEGGVGGNAGNLATKSVLAEQPLPQLFLLRI
jgi:hypothetical protein